MWTLTPGALNTYLKIAAMFMWLYPSGIHQGRESMNTPYCQKKPSGSWNYLIEIWFHSITLRNGLSQQRLFGFMWKPKWWSNQNGWWLRLHNISMYCQQNIRVNSIHIAKYCLEYNNCWLIYSKCYDLAFHVIFSHLVSQGSRCSHRTLFPKMLRQRRE